MTTYIIEYLAHGTTWTPMDFCTTNRLAGEDMLRGIQAREGEGHHRIRKYVRTPELRGFRGWTQLRIETPRNDGCYVVYRPLPDSRIEVALVSAVSGNKVDEAVIAKEDLAVWISNREDW